MNRCGHKQVLYATLFNEMLAGGETLDAKKLFEAAMDRRFNVGRFHYRYLINKLCKDENFEEAHGILKRMMQESYGFDPASFMPVIDALTNSGSKHEANELAENMLNMASGGKVENKIYTDSTKSKSNKFPGNEWKTILHRDDGSVTALKTLKRVLKGWGQGDVLTQKNQTNDFLDDWNARYDTSFP